MRKVVIIGGGIGGLCTALALQRRGMHAEVYEAAPALRPVGTGIWVPINAMLVLDRLAVSEAVAAAGVALEHIVLRDANGTVLQTSDFMQLRSRFGHTTVSIHRAVLQQVLVDHLLPDTLHLGERCVRVVQEDGIVVTFEDGHQARADVLVGADGIHSVVRNQCIEGGAQRYAGQTCYRGVASFDLPVAQQRMGCEVWGGAVRFGFSPIAAGRVYWFAPMLAALGGNREATSTVKDTLLATYASFPHPIPDIVAHTDARHLIQTDLYDITPLPRWWKGDVVLLGDAAHAMLPNLGQGGAQAIEDAYVLTECLARHATNRDAFLAYEAMRLQRVQKLVRYSRQFGVLAHWRNPMARVCRNLLMRSVPTSITQRQLETLFTFPVQ